MKMTKLFKRSNGILFYWHLSKKLRMLCDGICTVHRCWSIRLYFDSYTLSSLVFSSCMSWKMICFLAVVYDILNWFSRSKWWFKNKNYKRQKKRKGNVRDKFIWGYYWHVSNELDWKELQMRKSKIFQK